MEVLEDLLSNNTSKFEVLIASVPHREELVAEIFHKKVCLAEISHEGKDMLISFYSRLNNKEWELPLKEVLEVLEQAKQRLLKLGPKDPLPIDERFKL